MNKTEIETALQAFLLKKFPKQEKELELVLRNKNEVDVSSSSIQWMVWQFNQVYLSESPQRTSLLCAIVKSLAEAFFETDLAKSVEKFKTGEYKKGVPVPIMEQRISDWNKQQMIMITRGKTWHYSYFEYRPADFRQMLTEISNKMHEIFFEILTKYDIPMPTQYSLPTEATIDSGVMQPL